MSEIAVAKLNDYERGLVPPSLIAVESESLTSFPTTDSCSTSDDNPQLNSVPLAICGMATRLPGGISSAEQLWEFLLNKRDGCSRIPNERYTTHLPSDQERADGTDSDIPHWKTHGYMLDHVDLAAFDSSLFSMTRAELGIVDPQQRILLELTR